MLARFCNHGLEKARTILVPDRLSNGYRRLLVRVLQHQDLREFYAEPATRLVVFELRLELIAFRSVAKIQTRQP